MAKYEYRTDGKNGEFEAWNDEQAIEIAEKETRLTQSQIEDGAWLRVYGPDGAMIYQVEEVA